MAMRKEINTLYTYDDKIVCKLFHDNSCDDNSYDDNSCDDNSCDDNSCDDNSCVYQ